MIDWTNQEAPKCFEYRILLHQNQNLFDNDIVLMRERQLFLMSKMVITLAIQERQKWKCGKKHIKE